MKSSPDNIVNLTPDIIQITRAFSEKVAPTTREKHLERNHTGTTSESNHFTGTLGEWAVYLWAKSKGGECTPPDLEIYNKREKSYKKDLVWNLPDGRRINLHVKSQTEESRKRYGFSWVFTKTDRINYMTGPKDYVVLTYLHSNNRIEILKIVKGSNLVKYFKEPVIAAYKDTKRAIYYKDFADLDLL
jgi:hypothetical protein